MTAGKKEGDLGIKKMRTMNSTLMAKLGWKILMENNKLWTKVIISKYVKGSASVSKLVEKKQAFNAWRGIVSEAHLIQQGESMAVGNGKNTFFWRDKRLGNKPIMELAVKEIPMNLSYCMVHEYWEKERNWKWELINEFLPLQILHCLAIVLIREEEEVVNEVHWEPTESSRFTVKSV